VHFHVVTATQPRHCQRRCIVVVMRVDHDAILPVDDAAYLTSATLEPAALECAFHGPVRPLDVRQRTSHGPALVPAQPGAARTARQAQGRVRRQLRR
jgi:hypothetical protein